VSRRLYFLFPSEPEAHRVLEEFVAAGVNANHIHAIGGEGRPLTTLPPATLRQRRDVGRYLEQVLWNGNFTVFSIALVGLIASLFWGFSVWSTLAIGVMLATFVAGVLFAVTVPDVHLHEFRNALSHDELLLMVDVPKKQVAAIEDLVYRRHPEALAGGATWTIEALGI